jgi:tRNA threonylcarbamoyladenosine modification (KEOPS) complex  Pcc1 subunit
MGCGLLQLKHTVPPDLLYRKFWYKSGVNQTIRNDLEDIVRKVEEKIDLHDDDFVIDIGANDGTLLRFYKNSSLKLIGFEPATNLLEEANSGTFKIFNEYFNSKTFEESFGDEKAKIITSISIFYDLDNPHDFVEDITKILDENGIWILQMNYLVTMLENFAFDNIVHEHLEYYSLQSLEHLLDKHGLEVFDVEQNNINGGSIRAFIKFKNSNKFSVSKRVNDVIAYEKKIKLSDEKTYLDFAEKIKSLKQQTCKFIKDEINNGKKFYVYGASTRGNTLLQYYGLNLQFIQGASERNPAKWGKYIVGSMIPIISEEQARLEKPDYFLVLPWYFADEFVSREKKFLEGGGKFLIPLPQFKLIDSSNL